MWALKSSKSIATVSALALRVRLGVALALDGLDGLKQVFATKDDFVSVLDLLTCSNERLQSRLYGPQRMRLVHATCPC